MSVDQDVRALKDRIAAAQTMRAGHVHQLQVAQAARDQARDQMKEEFGCDRIEDADALLHELEQQAAAECQQVEAHLAAAEEGL